MNDLDLPFEEGPRTPMEDAADALVAAGVVVMAAAVDLPAGRMPALVFRFGQARRANILSLPKLREKYDQFRLQAQRKSGGTSRTEEWRSMQERQMARAIEREREMGIQR